MKTQKEIIKLILNTKERPELPVRVLLERVSPRKLDDDNLRGALKAIRDAIADWLVPGKAPGRADDSELIAWDYCQSAGSRGVRVTISKVDFENWFG